MMTVRCSGSDAPVLYGFGVQLGKGVLSCIGFWCRWIQWRMPALNVIRRDRAVFVLEKYFSRLGRSSFKLERCLGHRHWNIWSCVSIMWHDGEEQRSVVDAPYLHFCSLVESHPFMYLMRRRWSVASYKDSVFLCASQFILSKVSLVMSNRSRWR